jgi:hypothetical protein
VFAEGARAVPIGEPLSDAAVVERMAVIRANQNGSGGGGAC